MVTFLWAYINENDTISKYPVNTQGKEQTSESKEIWNGDDNKIEYFNFGYFFCLEFFWNLF